MRAHGSAAAAAVVAAAGLTLVASTDLSGVSHGLLDTLARVAFWSALGEPLLSEGRVALYRIPG